MDRKVLERTAVSVGLRWGFILSPSARTGPSRLGPAGEGRSDGGVLHLHPRSQARYPEGGRRREDESPREGWRIRAHTGETSSTRAMSTWRTVHAGARAPRAPRVWLRSPRFFTPYRPTRTRQDLPRTSTGEPRTPSLSRPRRSVPHTCHTPECSTVSHGHSRAPTPPPTCSAIAAAHTADHATDLPSWCSA